MKDESGMGCVCGLKTLGVGSFGEGGAGAGRLFRVEPGHAAPFVLEQATLLLGCAQQLTLHASIEQDGASSWAAHFLVGMAKALVEDLAHGMPGCQT
ncbi:DUF3077 domain-containing protein [Pseudomonas sp. H9]|uniref:DUF3077 domain-containing protein n=1 Tax=Pseudomonas sp. H9 TaxID=483968 RepID=UPI0010579ED8|nr:DUF3077 domain-containing protein [Pseudomonas sp. H9]TDF85784.1 DUF3077 domain-containing protein [Pseudomonas sp. H9]